MKSNQFYIFVFIIISSFSYAKDNISPNTLRKSMKSVVAIYATDTSSKTKEIERKGSGVIIDKTGLIITNSHVIENTNSITVTLESKLTVPASIVSQNKEIDLALLKVELNEEDLNVIEIAKENKDLEIGERIYAIGNPFGVGLSVTSGIISALPYNNQFSDIGTLIQTDASTNPGHSGGALLNTRGELIGINTGILGEVFVGISFAIPLNVVNLFINRSMSGDKLKKYWIGLVGENFSSNSAEDASFHYSQGVLVTNLFSNGPAQKSGIEEGDIILRINNKIVRSTSMLSFSIASIEDDSPITISLLRDSEILEFIVIPEIPSQNISGDHITEITEGIFSNVSVANNSNFIVYDLGLNSFEEGVIIYDLSEKSFLFSLGVRRGDILLNVNDTPIVDVSSLLNLIRELKGIEYYNILIKRDNTEVMISTSHLE